MDELTHGLWIASILLLVALAVRLVVHGLHGRYRAFFFWVCFLIARNSTFEFFEPQSPAFFWFWLATEPLLIIAFIVVVFEIYALALQSYPGIQTASKRLLTLALVIASTISVISIFPDLQFNSSDGNDWFLLVNVIRRGVYTSLLAFLILVVSFISVFPIKLTRNTILHVVLFSIVFLRYAAGILMLNLQGVDSVPFFNLVGSIVTVVCYLGWVFLLSPSGEKVQTAVRSGMSSVEAKAILEKLKNVNDALSSSRKQL